MKYFLQSTSLLLLAILCGCEPKERVQWSPDGSRAAVLFDHHLHFARADGKLLGALAEEDGDPGRLLIDAFDWLPDGTGLVVQRIRLAPRWEDVRALMPEGEVLRVQDLAARMPVLLTAAVLLHGDAERADLLLARLSSDEGESIGNALRYAIEADGVAVRAALAGAPRALAALDQNPLGETGYVIHELVLVRPDTGGKPALLSRSFRGVHSLRLSPHHAYVAYTRPTSEVNRFDLEILALDGSFHGEIAQKITPAYDWTPDGTSLVYMEPLSREGGTVMRIRRSRVLDQEGSPLDPSEAGAGVEDLAYALIPFTPRLAVLPDGDVLFASQPSNLPVRGGEPAVSARLYRISAKGGDPAPVPTAEGALPMDLGHFVPSPDGRKVAVVESGTDAVAVVDLASGECTLVSTPHPGWKSRVLPAWRSANELTFPALDPATGSVRWVLLHDEKIEVLSADWPGEATAGWLEFKETPPAETTIP